MLYQLLAHLDNSKFKPVVISLLGLGDLGPKISELGVPVYSVGREHGGFSLISFVRLVVLLKRFRPDIVHTWMYHADLLGGIAAKISGCRHVIWGLHGNSVRWGEIKFSTAVVIRICAHLSLFLPTKILSCSVQARNTHAHLGYKKNKMQVIYNGFDMGKFAPNVEYRDAVRRELRLHDETQLIGLIARYDPVKNHMKFIDVMSLICKNISNVEFILVGDGVDSSNVLLCEKIERHGIANRVHLLGKRDDIPRIMATLDALASFSSSEAFPLVLGEAMAAGVPCVATDVGDSAEIIANTGYIVEPGDTIAMVECLSALVSMPKRQKMALSVKARERIMNNYAIDEIVDQYELCYETVNDGG